MEGGGGGCVSQFLIGNLLVVELEKNEVGDREETEGKERKGNIVVGNDDCSLRVRTQYITAIT